MTDVTVKLSVTATAALACAVMIPTQTATTPAMSSPPSIQRPIGLVTGSSLVVATPGVTRSTSVERRRSETPAPGGIPVATPGVVVTQRLDTQLEEEATVRPKAERQAGAAALGALVRGARDLVGSFFGLAATRPSTSTSIELALRDISTAARTVQARG